ncbi:hypothetical protein P7C71_g953, partial [Lecanoromycetidae sp. Uapishka_2]
MPTPTPISSGLDPIFLQKSDVLVRAELEQKRQRTERADLEQKKQHEKQGIQQQRQRIERILREQNAQKERQVALSQDALPEFDATEVLKKAQELVKPYRPRESGRAKATASSDSFDENTFYSSQMDESTTTEEVDESRKAEESSRADGSHKVDESRKKRAHQLCNFFRKRVRCKFGDECVFSHDPALRQKLEGDGSQAMNLDSVNADEQTSSRHGNATIQQGPPTSSKAGPPASTNRDLPTTISEQERALQERVAQLEAELQRSKADRQLPSGQARRSGARDQPDSQEESAYSPPPPDEFGRDVALRNPGQGKSRVTTQQTHAQPVREYNRRDENPTSPAHMRIVQNNLPSPVAPQPQRVSPLAVAKAPQVTQFQRIDGNNRHDFDRRGSDGGVTSVGPSPNIVQPLSSRKRRRGRDSAEGSRNVVPRRDNDSPVVRIKAEAISPPPFASFNSIREGRDNQERPRQLYVDENGRQIHDQELTVQQQRVAERPAHEPVADGRRPMTPLARRVISRNGQHYVANGEPDLRRVLSARQIRAPMSPAPYPVQYSAPQQRVSRATSQVYLSPSGQVAQPQYKQPVQPLPPTYANDRSPSPGRRMPLHPAEARNSFIMAPPPRRIVVDQYGNQFEEVSVPRERQVSLTPIRREGEYDSRYAHLVSSSASIRQPRYIESDEEGQYLRRGPSPTSPTYIEYPHSTRTRQVIGPRGEIFEDDPYTTPSNGPRVIEYSDARPTPRYIEPQSAASRYEEFRPPREGTIRMQSVRPIEHHYEGAPPPQEGAIRMQSVRPIERQYDIPQERVQRVQSVRPQPRIVSLGEKSDARPQVIRQVSIRPENASARDVEYIPDERQRYQYTAQGKEDVYDGRIEIDGGAYEGQVNGGRRVIQQRM